MIPASFCAEWVAILYAPMKSNPVNDLIATMTSADASFFFGHDIRAYLCTKNLWVSADAGKFQLGGVAGSLLAAVLISQVGVQIDNGIKAFLFALFIYAVAIGYAVTYIFGSFGAIIVCVNILPWFMKRGICEDVSRRKQKC